MKHKKKLVHIISSLKQGGAESLIIDLIRNLHDFEHHVIYFYDGPNRHRLQAMGIATYQVRGLVRLYDPVFWVRLGRLVHRLKPDCIHSALWAANFAARFLARLLRIPLVCVLHLGDACQNGKVRDTIDWATFFLSKQVVAVSQEIADTLKKRSWIPAERIRVITNGIDRAAVYEQARCNQLSKKELGFSDDAFIIGSVGRFVPRKNQQLLIRSFAHCAGTVEHARLVLIGFGPTEDELRALVAELGIAQKVRFEIGKSAYGYYPLFDCFVLSSYQEGISIALLEAMCFSLPCIVTSPMLSHEVIRSGDNGLLVAGNNEYLLTEALVNMACDAELRQKLGAAALATIMTHFDGASMVKKYRELFAEIE